MQARQPEISGGGVPPMLAAWWLAAAIVWAMASAATAATGTPPAAAELVIQRDNAGAMQATGSLPRGLAPGRVGALLPGIRGLGALATDGAGEPGRWTAALEALNIVLPRIAVAEIRLSPGILALKGRLKPGVSRKEVRPALRAALGPDWRLDFRLTEVPPEAGIAFEHDAGGTRLSGILPAGVSARQALTALGGAEDAGLSTGAEGEPGAWARALAVLDTVLAGFHRAAGRLSARGGLSVEGRLAPGQDRAALVRWAKGALPEGWPVEIAGRSAPAAEGARRFDPATRSTETLHGGRWLPDFTFRATAERCNAEATHLQDGVKLRFETGARHLDPEDAELLDRLAGLAHHCVAGTGYVLEIGGHTDSVGDAEVNRALSEARAESVRAALVRRGVPARAIAAVGHGAARPIADNDTEEGRARNRRITFEFRPPTAPGATRQALDR